MKQILKGIVYKIIYNKLKNLQREYKDYILIYTFAGIGDLCYSFAYLDVLKEIKKKKIMVITKKNLENVVSCYSAVDKIKILSSNKIKILIRFFNYENYKKEFNSGISESNLYYFSHWENISWDIIRLPNITYLDIEKYMLYKINNDVKITYPVIQEENLNRFSNIDFDKSIIINPFSNFLNKVNNELYEQIADKLICKGYDVYTNVLPYQQEIKNTKRLECSIKELYQLSKMVSLTISIRSGIIDFLINNGGRYLVIYPNNKDGDLLFRQAYRLDAWKTNSTTYEYFENENILEKLDTLL